MADSLPAAWRHTLAAAPDAPALIEPDGRIWSRHELGELAELRRRLLPAEVARRRVAFALPNGPAWFATFLALLGVEAVAIPLDSAEPPEAQRTLARAADAAFLLLDGVFEPITPSPDSPASARRRRAPAHALVKLTSGSTGRPRALLFSHRQMLADGRQVCAGMDIRPDDINLAVIPFGHSYGLGNLVMPLLIQGTALVCADLPVPHALAGLAARHRPTVFPAVPALLRALADSEVDAAHFASLRTVISAGSPLSPEIARAFHRRFGLAPHGFYGSSETGGICYDREGEATLAGRSVGTPLPGVSITPLRGRRFRVASPAVHRRDGFSPADRGELDPAAGELRLLGRSGRMVKIAGRRLDLSELENALRALPGVTDAFVMPHPEHPEALAAALASASPVGELRTALRGRIASWKIPRRLLVVPAFPLTPRGKTDTHALRAALARAAS